MENNNANPMNPNAPQAASGPTVVQTDVGAKDGQNKCPKCGSSDISLNVSNGKLRCNFCRHEFEPEAVAGMQTDVSQLQGQIIGSGASDIVADTNEMVTFKCTSCGAEVVIDTSEATQARCHWCRNTLSVNQQVPNGAVPDVVLPFGINKQTAVADIEAYVGKRKFFAHPTFKKEFTTQNVMGVYLPYMVVDVNAHARLDGQGEHLVRQYTRGTGDNKKTYYDADLYNVGRDFDLTINELTVESSMDKLNTQASDKTTNIINAIMPFDTENSVKWNANYLKGFTSEKRDTNVDQLRGLVDVQARDIARFKANDTIKTYDRGVRWDNEQLQVKGQQWKSAYLPVWLYSYQQIINPQKRVLHYVAVNGRTRETVGSVPIHMPLLVFMSFLVELMGLAVALVVSIFVDSDYGWLCLIAGFLYFFILYSKYRNAGARHRHEAETKSTMAGLQGYDQFVKSQKGLSNSRMHGANNLAVNASGSNSKMLGAITQGMPNSIKKFMP